MIKTLVFTVIGNTSVTDDVIFCNRLVFTGLDPRLVIKPKPGDAPGAQRILKIVADTIDTQASTNPEITYSLAKEYEWVTNILDPLGPKTKREIIELPAGTFGLDTYTKATNGADGQPNFSHGLVTSLFPDIATPNFDAITDPLHFVGAFPKASSGGHGSPGGKGGNGENGSNAPFLEIWTKEIVGPKLKLNLKGQEGGDGGMGGNGQFGGNGQMGSASVQGVDSNWVGVPTVVCAQPPGLGGDGGSGGNAGCGGDGGNGGNGGFIKIFYTNGVNLLNLDPEYGRGKGGIAGRPGAVGKGGKAGPPGVNIAECPSAIGSHDGPDGSECYKGNADLPGLAINGQDGNDGYYLTRLVTNIPRVSFF